MGTMARGEEPVRPPLFEYDIGASLSAYDLLRELLSPIPADIVIAFAVKSAPLAPLVTSLHARGAWAEIMSPAEEDVARASGVHRRQCVVNAPSGPAAWLLRLMSSGATAVFSHTGMIHSALEELGRAEAELPRNGTLLLRLHDSAGRLSPHHGITAPGKSWREAAGAAATLRRRVKLGGLHFHGRYALTQKEPSPKFIEAVRTAWAELAEVWQGAEVLNVGGGLPAAISSSWDGPAYRDALATLISELEPKPTVVIIEPGTFLAAPSGKLLLNVRCVDSTARTLYLDAGAKLLPEQEGAWSPAAYAPLSFRHAEASDGTTRQYTLRGPSCMGSDKLSKSYDAGAEAATRTQLIEVTGAGSYHWALATGNFAGGARDARLTFRGVQTDVTGSDRIRDQMFEAGWALLSTEPGVALDAVMAPLSSRLGLKKRGGVKADLTGYDAGAELWATVPHTDGTREAAPPQFVALRVCEPDHCGGGEDYLVPVQAIVSSMAESGLSELLDFAQGAAVPFRGRGDEPVFHHLLERVGGSWHASVFRPAVNWCALAHDLPRLMRIMETVGWIERLALESRLRIAIHLSARQTLLFDNRRFIHWRSGISPGSNRVWERRFYDVYSSRDRQS